jgi:hypothetical protein
MPHMQTGSIDRIAQRIANGVQANCGQKAVLITHSFGANIMAYMLHKPELSSWRCAFWVLLACVGQAAGTHLTLSCCRPSMNLATVLQL